MSEEIGNQTEESPEIERDAETEALFDSFGLPSKTEKKDVQFPDMKEPTDEEDPLTMEEDEETVTVETKGIKVKYNGEDKIVDESEAPGLIQKGMNYDKVQQKLNEQQNSLDRAAKLLGYKDHAELSVNLDKIEQKQIQDQKDQFQQLKQQIFDELVDAGTSEDIARAYVDNNPLVQQANKAITEREQADAERSNQKSQQDNIDKWQSMYKDPRVLAAFPNIVNDSEAFSNQGVPEFFTPEMQARINKGYDPLDAMLLSHSDKFQGQTKKTMEQKVIKQQQLGMRAGVDTSTATAPDEAALLPVQIALAEEFGVSTKGIQRQNQLLKNRR